jgi:hypothetical protein
MRGFSTLNNRSPLCQTAQAFSVFGSIVGLLKTGHNHDRSNFRVRAVLSKPVGYRAASAFERCRNVARQLTRFAISWIRHLPPVLCAQLTDGPLSGFANHFRLRNIDPADPGACARFTKDCLDYYSCNASPEFLNGADAHGMTPLMCALKSGDFDLVQDLRQHGAVVDSKVLKFAVKHEVPEKIIKYLFK